MTNDKITTILGVAGAALVAASQTDIGAENGGWLAAGIAGVVAAIGYLTNRPDKKKSTKKVAPKA